MRRRNSWFSCGAASAVATKLALADDPDTAVVYCDTGSEDADNLRFMADCVRWFNAPIVTLKDDEYADTWDLWERRKYMSGVNGAICTGQFKRAPRLDYQRPDDVHVFGYTADKADVKRAIKLRETYSELTIETPLIDRGLTKANCLALVEAAGLVLPRTYAMGFPNANCLKSGCCKAVSPRYWANHRKHFPEGFAETARIARKFGIKLAIFGQTKDENGKRHNIRAFIDDIPLDHPTSGAVVPACDFICQASVSIEPTAAPSREIEG